MVGISDYVCSYRLLGITLHTCDKGLNIFVTSVVTSCKLFESPCVDCQIHTYFLHEEKKPVHLLNWILFLNRVRR